MHIKRLTLRNFRSYKSLELSFSPGVNAFFGDNGQGKTNLLEALHVLSTGRSFRTHRLQDMIRENESYFYIEAEFIKDQVCHILKVYCDHNARKVTYNDTSYAHFSILLGIIPSVLLSPQDLSLISGAPLERRRFLDLHIAQIDPLYLFYLARYYKAMKQRNELLRTQALETIEAWEQIMAAAASYLIAKRKQTSALLEELATPWMRLFSQEKEELMLSYSTSLQNTQDEELEKKFLALWKSMRPKEMQFKATLAGPHREDLAILLCGKQAKHFFSEGQKRSCITSLRFAQWKTMASLIKDSPLLAIDDFGIQLDAVRKEELKRQITQFGQVFLTCPYPLNSPNFNEVHICGNT